ncbi:MAG TPA: helix-hairpin-helix domain-containing protein [Phycisphaerales bacterium]|nr:helix-hairpin-helix domain-containing protein [Phycisphaerales bacterium]
MLARISGTLESLTGTTALIAPDSQPDLAYELLIPAYLADRLGASGTGRTITLHTLQYLESQNQGASFIPRLLGFASPREREFFELLTSVKGLGNKRAMRAMAVEPHTIARAIAERNARFLQTLPEIGPKLAELIVHELKSKADKYALSTADLGALDASSTGAVAQPTVEPKPTRTRKSAAALPPHPATGAPAPALPPVRQTVDALIALGENPLDAERMVARVIDKARAAGQPVPASTDELLTAAYAGR